MTATNSDSPQPSLLEILDNIKVEIHFQAGVMTQHFIGTIEAEQAIERLLASAKLEKKTDIEGQHPDHTPEQLTRITAMNRSYNQGAAAQYAAILVALGGEK